MQDPAMPSGVHAYYLVFSFHREKVRVIAP
jgi:hypothetical protein